MTDQSGTAAPYDKLLEQLDEGANYRGYSEGFGGSWTGLCAKAAQAIRNLTRASLQPATDGAARMSSAANLEEAIRTAETMLSEHIEEFHDFDYQPHEVPPELQQLRNIQHHLLGTLVELDPSMSNDLAQGWPDRGTIAKAIHARRYHLDAKDTASMFAWYAEDPTGTDRSRLAIYAAFQDADAVLAALTIPTTQGESDTSTVPVHSITTTGA